MAVVINLVLVLRHTFKKRSQTNRRHKIKLFWERNSLESLKAPKELVNTRSFYATNFSHECRFRTVFERCGTLHRKSHLTEAQNTNLSFIQRFLPSL